jgi:hypothetical protein
LKINGLTAEETLLSPRQKPVKKLKLGQYQQFEEQLNQKQKRKDLHHDKEDQQGTGSKPRLSARPNNGEIIRTCNDD